MARTSRVRLQLVQLHVQKHSRRHKPVWHYVRSAAEKVGSADWLGVTLGAERGEPDRAEHGARRNVRLLRVVLQISIGSRRGQRAASCDDHERRAPARRRRRRGLDRECTAADLARRVRRRGVVVHSPLPRRAPCRERSLTSSRDVRPTDRLRARQPVHLAGRYFETFPRPICHCAFRGEGSTLFLFLTTFPDVDKIREIAVFCELNAR